MSVTLGKSFRRSSAHRDGTGIEYCFNDTPQHCAMPVPRLKQTSASLILCRLKAIGDIAYSSKNGCESLGIYTGQNQTRCHASMSLRPPIFKVVGRTDPQ